MNIGELLKRSNLPLVVLGTIILVVAAIGGFPFGNPPLLITDPNWRYMLTGIGVVLLGVGLYLVWWEYNQSLHSKTFEVKIFGSADELYKYVKRRISQAHKTVDDLTWGPFSLELKSPADKKAYQEYVETIVATCRKKDITYREVMSFPPLERLERAEMMLDKKLFGYHLRYYEFQPREIPPQMSFLVIDSYEVIFGFYRHPYMPLEGEVRLAIKNRELATLFQDYYNTIWHGANLLKSGDTIERTRIDEIRAHLRAIDTNTGSSTPEA